MNKCKFIYPQIDIHKFAFESVTTNSAVTPAAGGSYAASALAEYIIGKADSETNKQITTFKSIIGLIN